MTLNPVMFPLYRLPFIALQEVIRLMDLNVMFFFSLTSAKAKTMLKISLPRNYVHLDCSLSREKRIMLTSPSSSDKFVLKFNSTVLDGSGTLQLRNVRYITLYRDTIVIRENEPLVIMVRKLISHLAESFNFPKISMDFQAVIEPQTALVLMNHVKNLSLPMVKIQLWTDNTPAETYKAFLDEGPRIKDTLIMSCLSPVGFQYTPSEVFHLERFVVQDGRWVNFEDYINCKHVMIGSITESHNMKRLNSQRFNEFFKAWKKSSYRLERLVVYVGHSQGLNFEEVIMGLNGTNISRNQFDDSVEIEREDKIKATIRLTTVYLTLEIKS